MKAYNNEALIRAVLDDHMTADIAPHLKAALTFLTKLAREPENVVSNDLAAMRQNGLSDAAIEEAIEVCACFSILNRIASAFDYDISDESQTKWNKILILKVGYGAASIPG